MQSKKKSRVVLITSLSVSLFAVLSMSVSTFAWFQAAANVTVTATLTSTTITVNKPDDYAFYAYNGNTDSSHELKNNFTQDFTAITSSNLSAQTNLSSLNPGDIKTFCVVMSNHDTSDTITLDITKITSNDAHMENSSKHRYVNGTSTEINIGWAINIYSTAATSNTSSGYSTFVVSSTGSDMFEYTNNNRSTYLAGTTDGNAINLYTPIHVFNNTVNSATVYLYYSVVFTTTNDTLYREVDGSGNNLLVIPGTTNERQFIPYNDNDSALDKARCNSNCYQGMTFALNSLSLTF